MFNRVPDNNQSQFLGAVPFAAFAGAAAQVHGPVRRGFAVQTVHAPVAGHGLAAQPRADRVRRRAVHPHAVGAREPAPSGGPYRGRVRPQAGVRVHNWTGTAVRGPTGVLGPGTGGRREVDDQHPAHGRRGSAGRSAAATGRRPEACAGPHRQQADLAQPVDRVLELHHMGKLRDEHFKR